MSRKLMVAVLLMSVLVLSGCKTFFRNSKADSEIKGLQNQVAVLEIHLKENETELLNNREAIKDLSDMNISLREELAELRIRKVKAKVETKKEAFVKPTTKQVQIALSNAGFNPGPIDGKVGVQTRNAIRAFQKANGLTVDGKIGGRTWEMLKKFLYEKEAIK